MGDIATLSNKSFRQVDESARRSSNALMASSTLASFGMSLATGLFLYLFADMNWNAGQIILGLHIGLGVLAIVLFMAWMFDHLLAGIKLAKNRLFFWLSWLFFGSFAAILITGIIQSLPFFLYLAGYVWFYKFETYDLFGTIHLVLALVTLVGLFAHLTLPHWKEGQSK